MIITHIVLFLDKVTFLPLNKHISICGLLKGRDKWLNWCSDRLTEAIPQTFFSGVHRQTLPGENGSAASNECKYAE